MGNMNSIDAVHNTESGRRAIYVVKLQPGNLEDFVSFYFFSFLPHSFAPL